MYANGPGAPKAGERRRDLTNVDTSKYIIIIIIPITLGERTVLLKGLLSETHDSPLMVALTFNTIRHTRWSIVLIPGT